MSITTNISLEKNTNIVRKSYSCRAVEVDTVNPLTTTAFVHKDFAIKMNLLL